MQPIFETIRAFVSEANKTRSRRKRKPTSLEYGQLAKRELLAADLRGYDFDAPENNTWGETIEVEGTVKNYGNSSARSSYVGIYLSSDSTIDKNDVYLGRKFIGSISSGNRRDFTVDVTLPKNHPSGFTSTDSVRVGMIVDLYDWVRESNESNNRNRGYNYDKDRVNVKPAKADLKGTWFDSDEPLRWGQKFFVDGKIENTGGAYAPQTRVNFFLSSDSTISTSDHYLGGTYLGGISANSYRYFYNRALNLPSSLPSGFTSTDNVYIGMITDAYNNVSESNESNNRNQGNGRDRDYVRVTSAVTAKPDLVGQYIYSSQSSMKWGNGGYSVNAWVKNQGNATSRGVWANLYLSTDSNFNHADKYLGQRWIPSLAANQTQFVSYNVNLPTEMPQGFNAVDEAFIGLWIDPSNNEPNESNEYNNRGQGQSKDYVRNTVRPGNLVTQRVTPMLDSGDSFASGHRSNIQLGLKRIANTYQPIESNKKTWVVIHGRNSNANNFRSLAQGLDDFGTNDQVITLDWSEGARDHTDGTVFSSWIGLNGAEWIKTAAKWTVNQLNSLGISSTQINLVGHSWGSFIGYEIANRKPGWGEKIIALDPAKAAKGYDINKVNFAAPTSNSWAFYSNGLFGNSQLAGTADEAFKIEFYVNNAPNPLESHSGAYYVFESFVRKNNATNPPLRARLFDLRNFDYATYQHPWRTNGIGGRFETNIWVYDTDGDGRYGDNWNEIYSVNYVDRYSGRYRWV